MRVEILPSELVKEIIRYVVVMFRQTPQCRTFKSVETPVKSSLIQPDNITTNKTEYTLSSIARLFLYQTKCPTHSSYGHRVLLSQSMDQMFRPHGEIRRSNELERLV